MRRDPTLAAILLSGLFLSACSSDDDDGGGRVPEVIVQSRECARYIRCVEQADQESVTEALIAFGEASDCWTEARQAENCTADCVSGMSLLRSSNPESFQCRECELDEDCVNTEAADTYGTAFCEFEAGTCVQCVYSEQCSDEVAPFCTNNVCSDEECFVDDDCTEVEEVCTRAANGRRCGRCETDDDCEESFGTCVEGSGGNVCRECRDDDQCFFEEPFCGSESACVPCRNDDDCGDPSRPFCTDPDSDFARCSQCRTDLDCDVKTGEICSLGDCF